jgi:hypothetical protein
MSGMKMEHLTRTLYHHGYTGLAWEDPTDTPSDRDPTGRSA